ncbi:hypothetical protein JCM17845_26100 [Iodidimonas gelatinilytica]|uniref:LPS export ABC transporter periplasmic protein LptC n=2 Tax=Iodidimonas gelatinilytica TaxID=1236966 RepID=A0A5A7N1U9_9PROT|nr:hypothetical protein JCM17845_26100 [Iodidimonas gelatinilytica]
MPMAEPSLSKPPLPQSPPGQIFRVTTAYDRYVAFMRPALILLAIASAGLSFLWPLFVEKDSSFVFNRETMQRGEREVRVLGPIYRGTDESNRLFSIQADEAVQTSPDAPRIALTGLKANMDLGEGRTAFVAAEKGIYDTSTETVEVVGPMHLETSDGYSLEGTGAMLDLKNKIITSDQPVEGVGPLGQMRGDRITLDVNEQKAVLEGAVKMKTIPAKSQPAPREGRAAMPKKEPK